jgi:hypothetical protein
MDIVEYLTGLALVGLIVGGFWLSARRLRVWLMPDWTAAPAVLTTIVLTLSTAVVVAELLGLVGLLNAPALAIVAIGLAIGLSRWRRAPVDDGGSTPHTAPEGRLAVSIAIGAALLTAIHWAGPVLQSLDVGIYRQDSLWYHMPFAAWFAQTGSVGGLLFTDPLKLAVWYYPLNSELLHAIGMVALGNDLLSPVLNFGWMGLALLAAWCVGRPFGLASITLLGAVLIVDSDMMLIQAGNAPSDIMALACLLAAVAILANGWTPKGLPGSGPQGAGELRVASGPLAVAALAAGLAIGTKVTMLAPVVVITGGLLWMERGGAPRRAGIWLGGLLATGGFWYLRNLIHSGNPLPWINFGPLPGPNQEALYPRPAHSIAEYVANQHVWDKFFLPGLDETLGPLWFVVLFAALAGIVLGLRRRHSTPIRILALAGAAILIAHVFNPISASGLEEGPYGFASNLRYAAPGMVIGLILLPLCESRFIARRVLLPTYALVAALTAIASTEWIQPQLVTALVIGAAAVLVPVWLLRTPATNRRRLVLLTLVAIAVTAGYVQQRQYFEDRYRVDVAPPLDNPGFRATPQWRLIQAWAREQRGLRIGVVGTPAAYGQYVLYGEDLSNEVRYLGEAQPAGGLTPIASCRRWRDVINAGHFDAILITPEDLGSPLIPPQVGWTATDGAAKTVLRALPAGLFWLTGPLDPSRCAYARSLPPGASGGLHLPPGQLAPGRPLPQFGGGPSGQ